MFRKRRFQPPPKQIKKKVPLMISRSLKRVWNLAKRLDPRFKNQSLKK